MIDARRYAVHEALRDGTPMTIRAARPDDRERIARAFGGLDRESVYTRFFAYKDELGPADFARLDATDFDRHAMLVATIGLPGDETVIAGGSYSTHVGADGAPSAEIAFLVEEDYRGNNLAGRLLAHLTAIARDRGIARFEADVLAENKAMLVVFERSGLPMRKSRDGGVLHVTLDL